MAGTLERLNPEQRAAAECIHRPVLVMAPVGTGKTNLLAARAGHAIASGMDAKDVLCLSFTNKAAREMRARLVSMHGRVAAEATVNTFHGLCASILRAEASAVGLDGDFVIYDEEDATQLISQSLSEFGVPADPRQAERINFFLFSAAGKARLAAFEEPPVAPALVFSSVLESSGLNPALFARMNFNKWLAAYVHELRANHAIDFTDLLLGVLYLWRDSPQVLKRWQSRFQFIQVDEVQDTSLPEYLVLRSLAEPHGQFSFFGDVDQTIYEWRGSAPRLILERYKKEFDPLEVALFRNYRSTQGILEACEALIRRCPGAVTKAIEANSGEQGEPITFHQSLTLEHEAEWIAARIRALRLETGVKWSDCAVLVRSNFTARDISASFYRMGIPHLQVDRQKFFQRAEIKTALAYLKLLVNPFDSASLLRVLQTPPKGIGEATVRSLKGEPRAAGLRIGDLLEPRVFEHGDPFAPLLAALEEGRVVVFDCESTGLDPFNDEVVELAAARCGWNGVTETFHTFIRPVKAVGSSKLVHGWTDGFLLENGSEAAEALSAFLRFCDGCVVCGHNIKGFDIPILRACFHREALPAGECFGFAFDTLDMTRRLHRLPRYTLAAIAGSLGLLSPPTHRAADDVAATVELLLHLASRLGETAAQRREAVGAVAKQFAPVAKQFSRWRERMSQERPHELATRVALESGLGRHYEDEPDGEKRILNLEELCRIFARYDDASLAPPLALVAALNLAALSGDVERQMQEGDMVPILTVHQSKGLEFDAVFVAAATDDEFPNRISQREGRVNEEHRLFYVALSRARRRLFVSWHEKNIFGRSQTPSRFISVLPGQVASLRRETED